MNRVYLYLLLFFVISITCKTQNVYSFQKSTETYSPIISGTVVSGTAPWSPFTAHTVPIGFSFNYFGNNYTTIYCEGSGFCVFDPSFYYYTVHPYTVQMRDAGTSTALSQSPISYSLSGVSPNRICKIQWQNCEMQYNLGSYANFQLWLYETSNILEARIGNCTVSNPSLAFQNNGFDGPLIAIYKTQGNPNYGYCVQGTSPSETLLTLNSGTISNIFQNSMSAPPPSGLVYKFIPGTSSGLNDFVTEKEIVAYPNPSNESVILATEKNSKWEVYNSEGVLIKSGLAGEETLTLNIESLSPGLYVFKNKHRAVRIIKQ